MCGRCTLRGGLPLGSKTGKLGTSTPQGEWVISPVWDHAEAFHEGLTRVYRDGLFGYINPAGEVQIPLQFLENHGSLQANFENGAAFISNHTTYGKYINRQGEIVSEYRLDN